MKKFGLYVVMLLCVIAAGKGLVADKFAKTVSIEAAFEDRKFDSMSTVIEGIGKFGNFYMSEVEKETLVKNIAGEIGLDENVDIVSSKDGDSALGKGQEISYDMSLEKKSDNGDVIIRAITKEKGTDNGVTIAMQYVYVSIEIYGQVECATAYYELLESVFESYGIDGNVNMNLVGSMQGKLNLTQKDNVTEGLLKALKAEVVAENRTGEPFTIYAYSKGIEPFMSIGTTKVNVNISFGYDELQDVTKVYLSMPINSLEY